MSTRCLLQDVQENYNDGYIHVYTHAHRWKMFDSIDDMFSRFDTDDQCDRQTDGRTDGR